MNNLIEEIKKACQDLFSEKLIITSLSGAERSFIISGNDLSPALNNHNGTPEKINALKWFQEFWIYIEINFKQVVVESKFPSRFDKSDRQAYFDKLKVEYLEINNEYFNVIISISVFQGDYQIETKKQLFRAEWDNYEDNKFHPQPHWHFYPEKDTTFDIEDNLKEFETDDNNDFTEVETKKEIDLKRMHFAINGQWAQNGVHIHKINDSKLLVNWLSGVLRHIKDQLEKTKTLKL